MRSTLLLAVVLSLVGAPGAAQQDREAGASPRPVAARDLARGVVLTAADVAFDRPPTEGAPVAALPVGWVTRRMISAGEVLRHPAIIPPQLVRAGDAVQLLWLRGGVRVSIRGTALGSAALGERVGVRVDARRRFEGIAVGQGIVRIDTSNEQR